MTCPTNICLFGEETSEIPMVIKKHLRPYFSKTNLIHCPLFSVTSFSNLIALYCFLSPSNTLLTLLNPWFFRTPSTRFTNSCFSFSEGNWTENPIKGSLSFCCHRSKVSATVADTTGVILSSPANSCNFASPASKPKSSASINNGALLYTLTLFAPKRVTRT